MKILLLVIRYITVLACLAGCSRNDRSGDPQPQIQPEGVFRFVTGADLPSSSTIEKMTPTMAYDTGLQIVYAKYRLPSDSNQVPEPPFSQIGWDVIKDSMRQPESWGGHLTELWDYERMRNGECFRLQHKNERGSVYSVAVSHIRETRELFLVAKELPN